MEAYDPTSWTEEYVRSHKSDCIHRLSYGVKQSIDAINANDYHKALFGLSCTFKGLATMDDSGCGNYTVELLILAWSIGNIVAIKGIGPDGEELSNTDRIEGAKEFYELCLQVADEGEVSQDIKKKLSVLKGTDKYTFKQEAEPDFPRKTLIELEELKRRMESLDRSTVTSSSSSSSSGGCYVATCVYGSYDCPQVWTLRRYRDYVLAQKLLGRSFIRIYYAVSPTIVKWFGQTKWFQYLWRHVLDRGVAKMNQNGIADTPYQDIKW